MATARLAQPPARPEAPSPRHFWHSIETSASPEHIWEIWTDVATWKDWDSGLQDAEMEDAFALNSKGVILSLDGRKARFKVVAYQPGQSYTYKTRLPLGGLYVKRTLSERNGQTVFTHEVWFSGLTKGIFAKALGADFMQKLPGAMQALQTIAERS